MADDSGEEQAGPERDQYVPLLRQVQQFIAQTASNHDVPELARQLREALGLTASDLADAVRNFGDLTGTAASTSSASGDFEVAAVTGSGGVALPKMRVLAFGDVAMGMDTLSVVKTEAVSSVARRATRDGTFAMDRNDLFIAVLILVVLFGAMAIVPDLPPGFKADLGTDTGLIGVALGLFAILMGRRRG